MVKFRSSTPGGSRIFVVVVDNILGNVAGATFLFGLEIWNDWDRKLRLSGFARIFEESNDEEFGFG